MTDQTGQPSDTVRQAREIALHHAVVRSSVTASADDVVQEAVAFEAFLLGRRIASAEAPQTQTQQQGEVADGHGPKCRCPHPSTGHGRGLSA